MKKPIRKDFPLGLKGDRMYQNKLAEYNRAVSGNLSTTDKLFGMSEEAKAARRRAALRIHRDINKAVEGAASKVKTDFSKFNTAANKAFGLDGKPKPSKIDSSKYDMDNDAPQGPNQVKPAKTEEAKPKPKPQPAAAKPKPKPKQETVNGKTVTRVGPVNTPADKPKMNKLKIEKAMASTRKAYLKNLQEEAKKKSIAKGKANRSRRNTTARGPRDRY